MLDPKFETDFARHFRWTAYFVKAIFALSFLLFLASIAAGVWLVSNPTAIGEFMGQIVGGVSDGYNGAN